jgi:hypothetical protein
MALLKPSDGYFLAKREMNEALINRIDIYVAKSQSAHLLGDAIQAAMFRQLASDLEKFRGFVRNVMLWDTDNGK